MNPNEIFEQGMQQWQQNIDEMRKASETWTRFFTEQTRSNMELMLGWQKQSTELWNGFVARGSEFGGQERARMDQMGQEWQKQWQAGIEQSTAMARSFGESAEAMLRQSQAQMGELLGSIGMPVAPAAKPARNAKS